MNIYFYCWHLNKRQSEIRVNYVDSEGEPSWV